MSLPSRPSLAKSRSAASRRAPATTSNFWPLPAFLTVRFWIRPCASMLSANSPIPAVAFTLRTLATLGTSFVRAMCWKAVASVPMAAVLVIVVVMVVSPV